MLTDTGGDPGFLPDPLLTAELMALLREHVAADPRAVAAEMYGTLLDMQHAIVTARRQEGREPSAADIRMMRMAGAVCGAFDRDPRAAFAYAMDAYAGAFLAVVISNMTGRRLDDAR